MMPERQCRSTSQPGSKGYDRVNAHAAQVDIALSEALREKQASEGPDAKLTTEEVRAIVLNGGKDFGDASKK